MRVIVRTRLNSFENEHMKHIALQCVSKFLIPVAINEVTVFWSVLAVEHVRERNVSWGE